MLEHNLSTVVRTRFAGGLIVLAALAIGCTRRANEPVTRALPEPSRNVPAASKTAKFVGSKTCQDCHAEFYKLWSTSMHGLAMQPYTAKFASSPADAAARRRHDRQTQRTGRKSSPTRAACGKRAPTASARSPSPT